MAFDVKNNSIRKPPFFKNHNNVSGKNRQWRLKVVGSSLIRRAKFTKYKDYSLQGIIVTSPRRYHFNQVTRVEITSNENENIDIVTTYQIKYHKNTASLG